MKREQVRYKSSDNLGNVPSIFRSYHADSIKVNKGILSFCDLQYSCLHYIQRDLILAKNSFIDQADRSRNPNRSK